MSVELVVCEALSPEWFAARSQGLGASEVGAALGISPWESPFSLWHRRVGNTGDVQQTEPMHWGHLLEPVIRAEYQRRHPELVVTAPVGVYVRDGWRVSTPDGISFAVDESRVLLEVKTSRYPDGWGADGTDLIPPVYRAQVMWSMDILGIPVCHVAALFGGNEYREYVVNYDPDEALTILDGAEAFWKSLQEGTPPDLDGMDATYQTLRDLHPDIDGQDMEVYAPTADEYLRADLALKAAERDFSLARNKLLHAMRDARRATVNGTPVARRQPGRNGSVALYPLHPKEAA